MATMGSNQTVYSGPGTTYKNAGSVSSGETITVKFRESGYFYIEYSVSGSTMKKCGYVTTGSVNNAGTVTDFTPTKSDRYILTTAQTRWGPGVAYWEAWPLPKGLKVSYLNRKDDGYALVEFTVSGEKHRAYFNASNLGTSAVSTTVVDKMTGIAQLEVGYTELGPDNTKYGTWIGAPNASWCASFVSWCAAFSDNATTSSPASAPKVYKTAGVSNMKAGFENRLYATPLRGDVAFFTTSHVGLVVSTTDTSITVVEGNAGTTVVSKVYTKDSGGYTGWSGTINQFGR